MIIATAVSIHVCECCGHLMLCLHQGDVVFAVLPMDDREALAFGEIYVEKLAASTFHARAAQSNHKEGHA